MIYTMYYDSPVGRLLLAEKEGALAGVWIEGQKYFLGSLNEDIIIVHGNLKHKLHESPQYAGFRASGKTDGIIYSLIFCKCKSINKLFQISCFGGKLLACCRALFGCRTVALYN